MSRNPSTMTIVVTGGAGGIGSAIVERFARLGARLAIGDLDGDAAAALAERVGRRHACLAVGAYLDITDPGSWHGFLGRIGELGPVSVLINNAGIMPLGPIVEEPIAVQRAVFDVNVHGVINGTKAVAPAMIAQGYGHIVNIASAVGRSAVAGGATYSASKFATVGFSEATRRELAPQGVDVTVVLPTIVQTELAAGIPTVRGVKRVTPAEVAAVVENAVRVPQPELWVPTWTRGLARMTSLLPLRVQESMARAIGADRALQDADPAARTAYESRIRSGARQEDPR